MVSRFEHFSYSISAISRCWHKIASEVMEKCGLKGTYAIYLITIYRYSDGITAAKLGELCSKDKSDISRAISAMEKKGLVKREGINRNLYRALIKLTDDGKVVAEYVEEKASLAVELAGKELTDKRRKEFYEALDIIVGNLQTICEEGLPNNE